MVWIDGYLGAYPGYLTVGPERNMYEVEARTMRQAGLPVSLPSCSLPWHISAASDALQHACVRIYSHTWNCIIDRIAEPALRRPGCEAGSVHYCVAPWLRLRVWGVGYQGTDCRGRSPGKIQNTRTNLTSWAGPLALRVVGRAGR